MALICWLEYKDRKTCVPENISDIERDIAKQPINGI